MRRACLPARDLRILDPQLSYPSTILGREHAIVVNLEHIKAIITAQEVLLLNSKEDLVASFVQDLQRRLPVHFNSFGQEVTSFSFLNPSRTAYFHNTCTVVHSTPLGSNPNSINLLVYRFWFHESSQKSHCTCCEAIYHILLLSQKIPVSMLVHLSKRI